MRKSRIGAAAPKSAIKAPLTHAAVSRIQGAVAKQHGGLTPKGSYVGNMQRVVAKRAA